jgi:anti-anti-sigma factor
MMDSSTSGQGSGAAGKAMFVQCESRNGHVIARIVSTSVGQREAPIITAEVTAKLLENHGSVKSLIVDFANVGYMNSMGIGMCIELRNRATHHGAKEAVLYNLQPEILHVLKMTRLDKVFTIIDDAEKLAKLLSR